MACISCGEIVKPVDAAHGLSPAALKMAALSTWWEPMRLVDLLVSSYSLSSEL